MRGEVDGRGDLATGEDLHECALAHDAGSDLLERAGVTSGADAVRSTSVDGMTIGTPLAANAFFQGAGPESWHPNPAFFYKRGAGPLFDVGVRFLDPGEVSPLLSPA